MDISSLIRATRAIRHRGPDDEGYLLVNTKSGLVEAFRGDESPGDVALKHISQADGNDYDLGLAHRRLSILDCSSRGHQPMTRGDSECWIVYNGEIYNYIELRAQLRECGFAFATECDTEVILAAYEKWGEDCVTRFNGMWAFAIWDNRRRLLFCSRDHFGIKPFYYWDRPGLFGFSSEIKGLAAHRSVTLTPNWPVVSDFLVRSTQDPAIETFFQNVVNLPAATTLKRSRRGGAIKVFWSIAIEPEHRMLKSSDAENFYELLRSAVDLRLRSDVPMGTCLSGGLDSTTIASVIADIYRKKGLDLGQKCYSACYEDSRYDERKYIEGLKRAIPIDSTYIFPDDRQLFLDLDHLVWMQEMPFPTTSMYAQYCVMRAARQGGSVVLQNGQGADEILGGYAGLFFGGYSASTLKSHQILHWAKLVREYPVLPKPSLFSALREASVHLLPGAVVQKIANRGRTYSSDLIKSDLGDLAYRPRETVLHNLADPFARVQSVTIFNSLQSLLRHEDRNSMAFSVESRLPFLDYRLVEYVFRLPIAAKIGAGWTKRVMREAMKGRLPEEIRLRRDKMGYPTPLNYWLSTERGRQLIENAAEADRTGFALFPKEGLNRRLKGLTSVKGAEYAGDLWRMISVSSWIARFISSQKSGLS